MLPALGLATVVLAAVGALAARRLRGLVAYLVIGSAGTLLLAVGLGTPASVAAGLFYLVNSTLAAAAWYLLADRIAASRGGSDSLTPGGLATPWAALGAAFFIAAIAMAGLPPLGGFFGKALLLQAAGASPDPALPASWVVGGVLASSLLVMVALARAGSALFWERGAASAATPGLDAAPETPSKPVHGAATLLLLALIVAAAIGAGPLSAYTTATAAQLFERRTMIDAVLGAQPVPPALDVRREMHERGDGKGVAK
jgi:multicomponent K+:H+ antiporter subunit D